MSFKPTESQAIALEVIKEFVKRPIEDSFYDRVLVVQGQAGTGKSTIIGYALEELIKEDLNNERFEEDIFGGDGFNYIPNVFGVTVAHKAKNRLMESVPNCSTYAKFFGLKPKYSHNGEKSFEKVEKKYGIDPHKFPFRVVVFDESSMFDMKMINMIEEYMNSQTKIIFMGDPGQLPPITEKGVKSNDLDSPVFMLFDNKVVLKERVRQTVGNPILDLSSEIYSEIFGGQDLDRILRLFDEDNFKDGVGYRKTDRIKILPEFVSLYRENNSTRIICYRNAQIDKMNMNIRKKLFPDVVESFTVGDAIYMNKTYSNSEDIVFYNSDEYIIHKVDKTAYNSVDSYKVFVQPNNYSFLMIVSPAGYAFYKERLAIMKKAALTTSGYADRNKAWTAYHNFVDKFADVSYGYAFTAYKA